VSWAQLATLLIGYKCVGVSTLLANTSDVLPWDLITIFAGVLIYKIA